MSGKSTLEKLAHHYNVEIKLNEKLARRFVEIDTQRDTYFVIDNDTSDKNTLLVATKKHNDYVKIKNDYKAFGIIADTIALPKNERAAKPSDKKLITLFGRQYEIN
ncbi:hypothetical protein ABRZ79_04835 [Vibrio vulnificus]|uniref:hypothetical protein n=1 Tax=Vibrio TaxID=662 RepID=UPI0023625A0F|nr:hypothetical protein [Vibrio parahaemolyticus]HDY7968046.1 hypothetical protein [Vibrio vulnificus]